MPLDLDRNLIERARSGGNGLDGLISAVWPEAYRIALSILRDTGLAEDAAQEACAAMARSLSKLKNDGVFKSWMYKIIVNHAISVSRRRQPRTQALDELHTRAVHFDRSDALDIYRALGQLPVAQRAAVVLHYYAGLNSAEIAEATGLPRSTVRFHLMLARRALHEALSARDMDSTQPSKEVIPDVR